MRRDSDQRNPACSSDTAPLSPLSRHISPDGLGGEGEKFEDPVFPYWKFLQGAYTAGATAVNIKIGRSSATLEAYSDKPFPGLREACHQPPDADLRLEPWRSLVQTSVDPVALCYDDLYRSEFQIAVQGKRGYEITSSVNQPRGLPERTGSERYRMTMIHAWPITGNFFSKLTKTVSYRTRLTSALRQRASFFPIPIDFSGDRLALTTPEQVFHPKRPPQLKSIYYRAVAPDSPGRFASEAIVADAYSQIRDGQGTVLAHPQQNEGIIQLWLEALDLSQDETGPLRGWHQCGFQGRARNGRKGHPYLTDRTVMIPMQAEGPGSIAIVDRGVLLGQWEADLGVPGAMAISGAAGLRVDFKGTMIAADDAWHERLVELRIRASRLARD